jgi:group I intron endonuclease
MTEDINKKYGIIYVIENKFTGKMYVGQTVKSVLNRWWSHSTNGRCLGIGNAIKKYGKSTFLYYQIDSAIDQNELDKKEKEWIKYLNTVSPNGYNLTFGGQETKEYCDELKNKLSEVVKKSWDDDPDRKIRLSEWVKKKWEDPEYRSKIFSKESSIKRSISGKKAWSPERAKAHGDRMRGVKKNMTEGGTKAIRNSSAKLPPKSMSSIYKGVGFHKQSGNFRFCISCKKGKVQFGLKDEKLIARLRDFFALRIEPDIEHYINFPDEIMSVLEVIRVIENSCKGIRPYIYRELVKEARQAYPDEYFEEYYYGVYKKGDWYYSFVKTENEYIGVPNNKTQYEVAMLREKIILRNNLHNTTSMLLNFPEIQEQLLKEIELENE